MNMDNNKNSQGNFLERQNIDNVVDILSNMFGLVLDRNAIFAVVESCGGDMNDSIEAIIHIVDDGYNEDMVNTEPDQSLPPNIETVTQQNTTNFLYSTNSKSSSPSLVHTTMSDLQQDMAATSQSPTLPDQQQPGQQQPISYARAFKSTGTVPKIKKEPPMSSKNTIDPFWTDQFKRILDYHNKGSRTLIIMRGLSGSGKSWLARKIIETLLGPTEENFQYHICSSDSFFWYNGRYNYDRNRLGDAHSWNQQRVKTLLSQGVSPVIVDNTNTELWEMEPYMVSGIREGYYVEIVEPQNPWSKKPYLLAQKNTHYVSIDKIKRQLNRYEQHYSVDNCMKLFKIAYPPNKIPPLLRNFPIFVANTTIDVEKPYQETREEASINFKAESNTDVNQGINSANEDFVKKLEELEKVSKEWESGEKWEESTENMEKAYEETAISCPKPSRYEERLLPDMNQVEDWKLFTRFMPVWDNQPPPSPSKQPKKSIASKSFGTSIDNGDTDLNYAQTKFKVLTGKCRNINFNYIPRKEKIPDQRMLDKSTSTNEQLITEPYRCKNEEKHFNAFRKMFKNIPRADLRDIFDKCCGDVNWAVEIVLDGVASNHILVLEQENVSDTDDTNDEQCECAAAYEIIPNVVTKEESPTNINTQPEPKPQPSSPAHARTQIKKKIKKESTMSDTTMQLKKQLEQNVAIADKHYSEHCLKLRKLRRGEIDDGTQTDGASTSEQVQNTEADNNSDSESSGNQETLTETVNINLGTEFLLQLDTMYGRKDVTYPENIVPMVNMPLSTLNEINALWVESLSYQLDCQKSLSDILIKEDQDLAMALAETEAEIERQGTEPEVPDFKEIMDLDLALSLHQRDVNGEWRTKEPNDMAAKMTRLKLQNLFPDIQSEVLSELLMAHDNNFQSTVEVLLMSTGQGNILEKKNGINKFVMEKEIARQEQILKEKQNTTESQEEWPVLAEPEDITMSTVNQYRHDAQMHLERRNLNYNKARDSMNRGMVMIASYYSEVAAFHKKKFEEANSLAASSLIQLNAKNRSTTTLDLHWLYVAEAIETLDIFIDYHIDLMKEESKNGQHKHNSLFLITGRGVHSKGGPRVKPAVKRRLRERGLTEITQLNPGLITVRITPNDKLTSEINDT